jgi:hypothetical protein
VKKKMPTLSTQGKLGCEWQSVSRHIYRLEDILKSIALRNAHCEVIPVRMSVEMRCNKQASYVPLTGKSSPMVVPPPSSYNGIQ